MIPNIIHFIYFYTKENNEFPMTHYINIKSAQVVNNPEKIFFYTNKEPIGIWWEKAKKITDLIILEPPDEIFGNKLFHLAHKSDVARIKILQETGGIYLDLDILCKKTFSPLLSKNFVLGQQGKWRITGLCNGVILSEKNAEFLKIWLNEFKNFRSIGHDKYWAEMSVQIPLKLSKIYRNLIHTEPFDSFHFPLYYSWGLKKLFRECIDYKNAYCHHLWEGISYNKYLKFFTVDYINNVDTTYNIIARKFL